MVAAALATASDVPPMAALPDSAGSTGSASGIVLSATAAFFPTRQRAVAKYFLGLKPVLMYHSYMSNYNIVVSVYI